MDFLLSRRNLIKHAASTVVALTLQACAGGFLSSAQNCRKASLAKTVNPYPKKVLDIVNETLVIDMAVSLGNCAYNWQRSPYVMSLEEAEFLKSSGISVFHLYPGLPAKEAYQHAREYVEQVKQIIDKNSHAIAPIVNVKSFATLEGKKKLGFLIGFQNSNHFRNVEDVDAFFTIGQRVSQITQNERNRLGSGSMEVNDQGLTKYGTRIIERMNKLGMVVDVAHCGDRTTLDALAASTKPALITHANCRALNPGYRRDKTDEAIKLMAAKGGVIGLTGLRAFVRDREPTTLEHWLDHVDHIAQLVGIEHVGIGSDQDVAPNRFDQGKNSSYYRGLPKPIREFYRFRDKSLIDALNQNYRIYAIADGLLKRGYSDTDIRGVLGLNFKRVLEANWA